MKTYDFKKAKKLIGYHADDILSASLGMHEDWYWTAETVWEDGKYIKDLDKSPNICGIKESRWATPTLTLDFKDGTERSFECFIDDDIEDKPSEVGDIIRNGLGFGVLSGPAQAARGELES